MTNKRYPPERIRLGAGRRSNYACYKEGCGAEHVAEYYRVDGDELKAIADLSARLELSPVRIVKQALRLYQLQILGEPDVLID